MLSAIRKHTQSFIVKILAGLLIASFSIWGVGDMVNLATSTSSTVFEVGNTKVEISEVESEVRREINRLGSLLGSQLDIEEARALGIVESVLQRQINDTALLLAAQELGVAISDDMVRKNIRINPAFHSLGSFDRQRFQQVLNTHQLTENGFIAQTRQQMSRNQLLSSFAAVTAPKVLVDSIYRYRREKRIAETVYISDQDQTGIPEPDRGTLEKYHKDNAARFTAPEYRALTVIRLEAAELATEISVTDNDLRETYEAREDDFTTQETRRVRQIIVADKTTAEQARKSLSQGRDFAAVAKEVAKMDADTTDLGRMTRQGLPFPELVEAVFSLQDGGISKPLKSPLGWHLFRVTEIEQGGTKSFEEVQGDLRKAVALEKAIDGLFDLANRLEDFLGGGATLEEAANQLNLRVVKIAAVDKSGLERSGSRAKTLPGGNFLDIAFATAEGEDSLLTETGSDGYFVLRVDGITPPVLKPLDSIKTEVTEAWKAERRDEKSKESAKSVVARVNGGTSFDVIASEMRLSFKTSPAITRRPEKNDSGLPQALITKIFTVKPEKAVMARSGAGYTVARLKKIIPADPAKDQDGVKSLSRQIGTSLEVDLLVQLAVVFRDQFGVNVNRQTVNSLFTGTGSGRRPTRRR
jgi:peptidyl-prolyl cis-trans isomerase D